MEIARFIFNAFAENTYLLFDETKECVIIDPGCNNEFEESSLIKFIRNQGLKPVKLINTHFHIDHVLGNHFISSQFQLIPEFHEEGMFFFDRQEDIADKYGMNYNGSKKPEQFLSEGDLIRFGHTTLKVIHVPGHSRDSICLYNNDDKILISGDVLFQGSIGRTDLPGGDYDTLIEGIKTKLFTLDDSTRVFPGHGESTTIGDEKVYNPFFRY
ncbi:MAG TPA: MBL fold metallo-hydrolase [Saprospiraceae bacterium]|nr:MBL fold metallo-hydrolase [Saprospiraceae bacterium]